MPLKPLAALLIFASTSVYAQSPNASVRSIARFPFEYTGLVASGPARVGVQLIDEGKRATVRGDEMGALDVAIDSVIAAHNVGLTFTVPVARSVIARPEGPTIIYSHPAFTVREHVFATLNEPAALIVIEIETVRPLTFSLSSPSTVFAFDSARAASQYVAVAFVRADEADTLRAQLLNDVHARWQQKVSYYRKVLSDGVQVDAVETRVVQALQWAKVAADRNAAATAKFNDLTFDPPDELELERLLAEHASSATTADWGIREELHHDSTFDAAHQPPGAVSPTATANIAAQNYMVHRDWTAFDLVRDLSRETFDFVRGRLPRQLSGAYYQSLDTVPIADVWAAAAFVRAIEQGMVGWQADAQHHAAALEPHMPAEWPDMHIGNLRVGQDRLDATLARENGVFSINLHRLTSGAPMFLRVAPALPLGSRIDRIVVNDSDVPVQSEESLHDVHAVAEVRLTGDAQIEVHYEGGIDVLTPPEHVDIGEASHELKILDFRRDQKDYLITVEGIAASAYSVQMRSGWRVRSVVGSDGIDQTGERVTIRFTMPQGVGFVRKTLRVRVY